jgi:4-oxalocrotonate tautomerase
VWRALSLAQPRVESVMDVAKCREASISVSLAEVEPEERTEKVCKRDILENLENVHKKPGCYPLEK